MAVPWSCLRLWEANDITWPKWELQQLLVLDALHNQVFINPSADELAALKAAQSEDSWLEKRLNWRN